MERSRSSTIGSLFTATLLASAILMGGCADSLTGTTPPDAEEKATVEHPPTQHNTQGEGTDTFPSAGHNTTNED